MMQISTDMIGYVAAILTTSSFLPQAILTIRTQNTDSLSLSMYSAFTAGVFCWLIYGLIINNYAIIFANFVTLLLASTILIYKIYNTIKSKRRLP